MINDTEYCLFLEQVNKLAERRQAVTGVYLSVNAAIVSAIAFLFKDIQMPSWAYQVSALTLLIAGIVACALWRRLINQYSTRLSWWYEQLRALEKAISNSSKLLTQEYAQLYVKKEGKAHLGLTRYETHLTWLFTVIYLLFVLAILVASIWAFFH